ncbi:peptide chain release factor N(5)-glutamine methyltransferase [Pelagibacterales bacterium SAG-MED19]|nr:peptide chain release factor N(5)-glutamine methyltransferase [Pelagibacterales bacterium SAG-MED19]
MKIQNLINDGSKYLRNNNIMSYKIDSEILMSKVLKKKREYIILNPNSEVNTLQSNNFRKLIYQRSHGKPIAYLTGKKNFWNFEFKVSQDVLIPRPDTELLIEEALKITKNKSKLKVLDIGIGSGCILLSILKEKRNFYGIGVDLSKKCIDISKINALNLGVNNRIKFFKSDIDNFNYGKYDLIISNPPYINKLKLKYLEKDVFNFEPITALNGGLGGLSEIRKVIKKSSELIKKNGKFILEIAFDQKLKVLKLLTNQGFYINKVLKDYAKNDRCIVSTRI